MYIALGMVCLYLPPVHCDTYSTLWCDSTILYVCSVYHPYIEVLTLLYHVDGGPQCELYNDTGLCRLYGSIGYDYIYTNTTQNSETALEGYVIQWLQSLEGDVQMTQKCLGLIMDFVCHYYFPSCDLSKTTPQPIQVGWICITVPRNVVECSWVPLYRTCLLFVSNFIITLDRHSHID